MSTETAPSPSPRPTKGQSSTNRLRALDVMRGVTILAMILVNNPGSWGSIYPPLAHAEWHGVTPTDLIFPFFLFMVGVSMAYSFRKYAAIPKDNDPEIARPDRQVILRILRRVGMLLLLGLLLNGSGRIITALLGNGFDLELATLRWPGVLQRIGLAYLFATGVILYLGRRGQVVAMVLLQVGYWALLVNLPADVSRVERFEPSTNVVRVIDRATIGPQHMWSQAPTDPEGLLSTLPAIVSVLFGYRVGRALNERTSSGKTIGLASCGKLIALGSLLTAAGWIFSHPNPTGLLMPINKALWTPTFVLFSTGCGFLCLATCLLLFDVLGNRLRWLQTISTSFELVGVNAIFAYVTSSFVARLLSVIQLGTTVQGGSVSLKAWLYQQLCIEPLGVVGLTDPRLASFIYALGFVACWWIILWGMWRRGWTVRV